LFQGQKARKMLLKESNNLARIRFIKKLGFKEAQSYIWYSKKLEIEKRKEKS